MSNDEIKLSLYDGSWWDSVASGKTNYNPHYYLTAADGKALIRDGMGLVLPPSVTSRVIEQLQAGIDSTSDEHVLQHNLEVISRDTEDIEKEQVPRPGFIYAVRCGNKLKIGRTMNLDNRFSSYRRVSGIFNVIATSRSIDYIQEEKDILNFFGGVAGKVEWFDYTDELKEKVVDYFVNATAEAIIS